MNDSQVRKMDKVDREDVFMAESTADFPPATVAAQMTVLIGVEKTKILQFDAEQTSGFDNKRQAQAIYDDWRDEVIDLINQYVLAAAIVDGDIPGTAAKYTKPYPRTDQNLIAKAASFAADSPGIETQLLAAGLEEDAPARLPLAKTAFQQAARVRDGALEQHAGATGGMSDSFRKMMEYSKRRDKAVRLKYRNNPAKLAAWTVASHLDRAPKRTKNDAPPTS